MLVTDQFVFVDLPKCASSHLLRILQASFGGERRGTHVPVPPSLVRSGRAIWSSIRNPWDWYVSLWAYGCDGKGALFQALTSDGGWLKSRGWKQSVASGLRGLAGRPRRHRSAWLEAYANAGDPQCFRRWLGMIHDPAYGADVGDGYAQHALASFAGLFTYRYLKICCGGDFRHLDSHEALCQYERQQCYVQQFIRVEDLEGSLVQTLAAAGIEAPARLLAALREPRRTNPSSRARDSHFYYDAGTARLVGDRDRLIADRFGYEPPRSDTP